mgnify:CR=1 FL=1
MGDADGPTFGFRGLAGPTPFDFGYYEIDRDGLIWRRIRAEADVSAADRVITLITPFTALAPQSVPPGPLITAAIGIVRVSAAVAAQPIEQNASEKVASRDEVWRRRKWRYPACS